MMTKTLELLLPALMATLAAAASDEQCHGFTPMSSVSTYLGAALRYSTAAWICCNNHAYAEPRGYLEAPEVDLFARLDPATETVFYDSVCGLPLFVAPRGRPFAAFREESLRHGWPSFRPEELVSENVVLHADGRMESACGTHLGHNLPEGGVDRYCIDLVCVAGAPLDPDGGDPRAQILTALPASAIHGGGFNATGYVSSAEQFSGRYPKFPTKFIGGLAAVMTVLAVIYCFVGPVCDRTEKSRSRQRKAVGRQDTENSAEEAFDQTQPIC